jgi:ATP-binding protein involved in chromosome partitioning
MSQLTESQIKAALESITLPYLTQSYAKVLKNLNIKGDLIEVHFELSFPCKSIQSLLLEALKVGLEKELPECEFKNLAVSFDSKILAHKAVNGVKPLSGIKNIIAVASGKGGVGKSSTSVNLALALQALGANVGLLDADIYGPNLALMLGVPAGTRPEVEGQKYMLPLKAQGIQSMSMSYVTTEDTPIVWRGPKACGAFSQLLTTTLWHELDYLLIDMPPGTGDIQLTMAQNVPVNGAVIVTTPQNMATQDAKKGIEMFVKVNIPILGVVENMSTHICSNCGHEEHIFGTGGGELLAQKYEKDFLGAIPLNPAIREDCDNGFPTVARDPEGEIALRYQSIAVKVASKLALSGETLNNLGIKLVSD